MELLALITLRVTEPSSTARSASRCARRARPPLRARLAFCLGVVVLSLYNGRATRITWAFAIVAGAAGSCGDLTGWAAKCAGERSDSKPSGRKFSVRSARRRPGQTRASHPGRGGSPPTRQLAVGPCAVAVTA